MKVDAMITESKAADGSEPALAVRKGKLRVRVRDVSATVTHYVGAGVPARLTSKRFARWRKRYPMAAKTPFTVALWLYSHAMLDCGHYLIGGAGECVQTVPEDLVARHVGGAGGWRYRMRKWWSKRTAWWLKEWPGLTSPRQLAGGKIWAAGSVNENSLGIEVAEWTPASRARLALLLLEVHERRGIPLEKDRALRHCDVHPRKRTTKGGEPWDPSTGMWTWDDFVRLAL